MKRAACLTIALLVGFAGILYSADLEGVTVKGGMIWIGNAPADADTPMAPSPLTTVIGAAFPIRFSSVFLFVPELRYYGAPYGIENDRVVPVEEEFADWAWVMGLLVEPRAVLDFRIRRDLNIGLYASPTLLLRIPARRWGDVDGAAIAAYQYGDGRFFYPEVGFYFDWEFPFNIESAEAVAVNEGEFADPDTDTGPVLRLVFDFNAYFPLFHAWDGEGLPFYDQLMLSGTIGIKFLFD